MVNRVRIYFPGGHQASKTGIKDMKTHKAKCHRSSDTKDRQ